MDESLRLPTNPKSLLDAMAASSNPTQLVSEYFDAATDDEDRQMRRCLKQLREGGFVDIPMWADDKPYRIIVNHDMLNVADSLLPPFETAPVVSIVNDNSIRIGDGSTITGSSIGTSATGVGGAGKQRFSDRHPLLVAFAISLIAGFVLLFSFWGDIVGFIEGLF